MNITGKDFAWVIAVDNVPLTINGMYHIYTSRAMADFAMKVINYSGGTSEVRKVKLVVI